LYASTSSRASKMPTMPDQHDWPDELDALKAAPRHHTLLLENDLMRVLDTRVGPGQTVPLHTHRWPGALYIVSWSDFIRRDAQGSVLVDSRTATKPAPGRALWSGPLPPHTLENVGEFELRAISVELKSYSLSPYPRMTMK
jgi:hypothetical protein